MISVFKNLALLSSFRFYMVLFLLSLGSIGIHAQQVEVREWPDFQLCFDILAKNRAIYNQYNDSIFIINDHDKWVNFFRRRAVKNHQIFTSNKEVLRTIDDYFKAQDDAQIPQQAYEEMFQALKGYVNGNTSDPFLTMHMARILEKYYLSGCCPDSLNHEMLLNIWMATNSISIAQLGNDSTSYVKAYYYLQHNLRKGIEHLDDYDKLRAYTLWNLSKTTFVTRHIQTVKEFFASVNELEQSIDKEPLRSKLKQEQVYTSIKNTLRQTDESIVRNVYLVDTTTMDKHLADSLMKVIVSRNLANERSLSPINHVRTLLMQMTLGQMTATEALHGSLKRYKQIWKDIKKRKLTPNELADYIQPFYTFLYINDVAKISIAKKKNIVRRMCKDIETAYQNRLDKQSGTRYVRNLNILTTYPRITKYLTYAERIHFLDALNVATQVTTYAHSVHVSMIAEELMKGILKYQPELLVGALGHLQVSDILANQQIYLDFIHSAAMYHDLGKNSIISVVNNDYRPLSDEEFAIIKRHPELGLQYLKLSPNLAKFHDTTLGHHKWYNGKGGYPDSFDNTKSPMRIMIDIVTLSDCMQAATEQVGRNYKGDKTFDTVMGEFRRDAGTRYNPDLVDLIDHHEDVAKKLAELVNDGWAEIYYNIYSQFIK